MDTGAPTPALQGLYLSTFPAVGHLCCAKLCLHPSFSCSLLQSPRLLGLATVDAGITDSQGGCAVSPASVTSILVTLGSQVGSEWSSVGDRTQEAKKEVQEPGSEALADEH